jgi:hypothetical protein
MALEAKRSRYVAVAIARATWRVLGAVMGIQSARQAASAYPGVVLLAHGVTGSDRPWDTPRR